VPAAAEPQARTAYPDVWNAAYLEGSKAGFVHTWVREMERDGQKLLRITTEMNLIIRRGQGKVQMRMQTGDEETPEGKVTAVFMTQFEQDKERLVLKGTVADGKLTTQIKGAGDMEKKIPWNDQVIGMYRQDRLFQERKVKPGDQFGYLGYEPIINFVVRNKVTVKDQEEVAIHGQRRKLLRVEIVPDKLQSNGGSVQLPGLTEWLDEDFLPVKSQFEMPLLGTLVLVRTNRQDAERPGSSRFLDIMETSLIPLNRVINNANATQSAIYRITVKGDDDPSTAFAQDERQEAKNIQGNTFELHVRAAPPAPQIPKAAVVNEYLSSNYFITSDDPKIKSFTKAAIGKETDGWTKAKLIERWVHRNMRVSFSESFLPADEVAKTLRGDCRQHALLTTAMCRAADVPARVALGLVYAQDKRRKPAMAFHMWTEVLIAGQWTAIDATRGEGHVGATHLKITDHSWHEVQSMTPMLPVLRVMGKLAIEVVSVDGH
jgi:hypothetical protein